MNSTMKKLITIIGPTLLAILILCLGFYSGRFTVIYPFKTYIQSYQNKETLGTLIDKNKWEGISNAYYDSDQAVQELDEYSWAVPNAMAPFVGSVPAPGHHDNAYINSMQFRSEEEVVTPKPANVYRIFLTGGSTAFSSGAPSQEKTIAAYLSKLLNKELSSKKNLSFEVITSANPAWASTHERIMIENRLSELEPDMIVSLSGNNDVHWGQRGRDIFWFRTYDEDYFLGLINKILAISGFPSMSDVIQIGLNPVSPQEVANRLIKNVKLSTYILSLDDVDYFYFLQPTLDLTQKSLTEREEQYMSDEGRHQYFIESYHQIDLALQQLDISNFHYFNLQGIFDQINEKEDIFIDSYHFGDRGNEIIAQAIYRAISSFILKQ